jgi:hypothetical protein
MQDMSDNRFYNHNYNHRAHTYAYRGGHDISVQGTQGKSRRVQGTQSNDDF